MSVDSSETGFIGTFGEGKYHVWLKYQDIGIQKIYILGGGENSHIGGVTICEVGKEPQNTRIDGHHDCVVTEPIAVAACAKYKVKVLCLGGVHVDNASKEEIDILVSNCKELIQFI